MGGLGVHFRGIGLLEAEYVAGELDYHALHAEADSERRHVMLASPFDGVELAFDAALAESGSNHHSVEVFEVFPGVVFR